MERDEDIEKAQVLRAMQSLRTWAYSHEVEIRGSARLHGWEIEFGYDWGGKDNAYHFVVKARKTHMLCLDEEEG